MKNLIANAVGSDGKPRTCPVGGCNHPLTGTHCICAAHWNVLPMGIRQDVLREGAIRRHSRRHVDAIYRAVSWIESQKPKTSPATEYAQGG